jgi:hypothetical protein
MSEDVTFDDLAQVKGNIIADRKFSISKGEITENSTIYVHIIFFND